VISELHSKQTILLHAKTRSISVRIVNLVQRFVQIIVSGNARTSKEFDAKISVSERNGFAFLHRMSSVLRTRKTGFKDDKICNISIYQSLPNSHE
jgi:hypothetical protein